MKEVKVRWGIKSFGMVKPEWVHIYSPLASTDMEWLISEVERLRKVIDTLEKRIDINNTAIRDIVDESELEMIRRNIALYEKAVFK
ncbi:hypothetical protein NIE88_18725 [Sporolactobacillus shoreicorticis]|uniref:Phage protein n=1 Tax=Sporolactobacillus shoreicorticis TaxID=1923877 RepID=A0ABW5S5C3_9BACL|nr:hypothetical protein [Sporolactobacillus shoreicorticis]MCO7127784.1 hypothetical protein [Sporolactobacillus shoreicorticis]